MHARTHAAVLPQAMALPPKAKASQCARLDDSSGSGKLHGGTLQLQVPSSTTAVAPSTSRATPPRSFRRPAAPLCRHSRGAALLGATSALIVPLAGCRHLHPATICAIQRC